MIGRPAMAVLIGASLLAAGQRTASDLHLTDVFDWLTDGMDSVVRR